MHEFYVDLDSSVEVTKTVSESDVYMFAGITGDFSPNHVNRTFMQATIYGERIAHGALIVGFMSTASSLMIDRARKGGEVPVSLGYDRVRFINPVYFGDTITVRYKIAEIDTERRRSSAEIEVKNQDGQVVAAASHILKWVTNE